MEKRLSMNWIGTCLLMTVLALTVFPTTIAAAPANQEESLIEYMHPTLGFSMMYPSDWSIHTEDEHHVTISTHWLSLSVGEFFDFHVPPEKFTEDFIASLSRQHQDLTRVSSEEIIVGGTEAMMVELLLDNGERGAVVIGMADEHSTYAALFWHEGPPDFNQIAPYVQLLAETFQFPLSDSPAKTLYQEGFVLYDQTDYQGALNKYETALVLFQDIGDRRGERKTLARIAKTQRALGKNEQALYFYQQALAMQREMGVRIEEGMTLNEIAGIYRELGQYEQALDYYQQALGLMHEDDVRTGEDTLLNNMGLVYDNLGRHDAALGYYQQALATERETGDRAGQATTLNSAGVAYGELGQYEQALEYLQQALTIRREGGEREQQGTILGNIGVVYLKLGQYELALEYLQEALSIAQEFGNWEGESSTLNNIALVYASRGQYEQALTYYQRGLVILEKAGNRAGAAATLGNIGVVYGHSGQHDRALDYLQRALAINQEIGDQDGEATTLNNIGFLYTNLGQSENALDYYQQALAIEQEIGDQAVQSTTLDNIGMAYLSLEQYEQVLSYFKQALAIAQEIGNRAGEGTTLNNIGGVHSELGQHKQALNYLQQSLGISQEIGDRDGEGNSLNNIGMIHRTLGQYEQALNYLQQSLGIRQEIGDRDGEGITLSNIAGVYDSLGEYEQALDYYQRAMETLESVRVRAGSEQGRATFIAQYAFVYRNGADLFYREGQNAQAFYTSERGRARAFLDSLTTGQVRLSDDDAAGLLAQEQEWYSRRLTLRSELAEALALNSPDPDHVADLKARLAEAEAAYEAVQEAIATRGAELAALVPGRGQDYVLSVPQVQELLDEQTTLLSYFVLEDQTLAFVITRDSFETVSLAVTPGQLVTQIRAFRDFPSLDTAYPDSAITLYGWLIEPLREYLTTPHVGVIPHSVLHYLPFAALTDGEHYLIDDYILTTLPSASALPFIQENARRSATSGQLPLILGNPTSGDYDATASFATERDGLGSLPFAEKEAKAIAALYGVEPLIGKDATEGAVRERASGAGILHLAAHGFYNAVAPLSSLVALAPDDNNDGWLTVGEVYGLDLSRADLVVLSACQTNLGELSAGDELVGLTRAFIFAGTPTVVASLWSVEDESTALLMERFYTHLRQGMGKAPALRQAQLEVRDEYPNPYYWAGFVLSGDGGEMGDVIPTTIEEAGIEEVDATLAPAATLASEATPLPELVTEEQESQSTQATRSWRWPSLVGALLILLLLSSGAIVWRRAK